MTALNTKEIKDLGRAIVLKNPGGIRFRDIVAEIMTQHPDAVRNTVEAQIASALVPAYPSEISKASRGLYIPVGLPPGPVTPPVAIRDEGVVYEPFARFLEQELEEANAAFPIGGAAMRVRWGTPDVVGVYRPRTSDLVKFTPEIVAAEIKADASQSVVAFGQAIAYRLFATRSYIVMPNTMTAEDQSRLESLCMLFGLGFVQFSPGEPKNLRFEIRVRAQSHAPDSFYVNEFAHRLRESHPDHFERLFG